MRVFDSVFMLIFAFIIISLGIYLPIMSEFRFVFYSVAILFIGFFLVFALMD